MLDPWVYLGDVHLGIKDPQALLYAPRDLTEISQGDICIVYTSGFAADE